MTSCQLLLNVEHAIPCKIYNNDSEIFINDASQPFTLLEGWQILEITTSNLPTIIIEDIKISNQSIREHLYTSWLEKSDNIIEQPSTWLSSNSNGVWKIVLHSNLAIYKQQCYSHLMSNDFGKNITDKYNVFVDLGKTIPDSFPPSVVKFFEKAEGISWYSKHDVYHNPYIPLDIEIPYDYLISFVKSLELPKHKNPAHNNWYIKRYDSAECPAILKDWATSIGFEHIKAITVTKLDTGGYIDLHKDDMHSTQIHINLSTDGAGIVKVAGGGIMPHGANYIGNKYFVHSAINYSDEPRYAILVIFDHDYHDLIAKLCKRGIYYS